MGSAPKALTTMILAAALVAACQGAAPATSQSGGGSPSAAPTSGSPAAATASPSAVVPTVTPGATAAPVQPMPSASAEPSPSAAAQPTTAPRPSYSPAPQPPIVVPGSGGPAIPASAHLDYPQEQCTFGTDESCELLRATWTYAQPANVTVRIYGVTSCLHPATATTPDTKCMLDGDTIPSASLVLLGTAPASANGFTFKLGIGETAALGWMPGFGPEVDSIVLQAVDATGGSYFAIAGTSGQCYGCTL